MNTSTNNDPPDLNRHERRKLRTRKKLKEATLALVLEKGFDNITIQEVVDLADLGRGTFYIHYHDLQDILWDIIQDGLKESLLDGKVRSQESNRPPGYLGYLITFETANRHQELYKVMLGSKGSALITHRVADYLAAEIQQGITANEYMTEFTYPPEILAQFAIGALMRMTLWWLETPNNYTPEEMADIVYTLVHKKIPH